MKRTRSSAPVGQSRVKLAQPQTAETTLSEAELAELEAAEQKRRARRRRRLRRSIITLIIALVLTITVYWLLHGRTVVSGRYPEDIKSVTLDCISEAASPAYSVYARLGNIAPSATNTKVTSIFFENEEFSTISLVQTLTFPSRNHAVRAEAVAHANFNWALHAAGHDPSTFDNKFTVLDNRLVISVHGKKRDWESFNRAFFMVQSEEMPATLAALQSEYEAQGFSCQIIE